MQSSQPKAIPDFPPAVFRTIFALVKFPESGCWEWSGYRDKDGYGVVKVDGIRYRAHRVFYSHLVGVLNPALVIDHLCRNTSCVNPQHLEQVTGRVNVLRGIAPIADFARRTHCPKGHEYNSENTYTSKAGSRHCVTCSRENTRLWRARQAEMNPKRERVTCKKGHPWIEENIMYQGQAKVRRCRICHKEYERARNEARRVTDNVGGV